MDNLTIFISKCEKSLGIARFLPWIALLSGVIIIGGGVTKMFGRTIHINMPSPRGLLYTAKSGNKHHKSPIQELQLALNFFHSSSGYCVNFVRVQMS
ncbi:MAG: hypothetical protein JO297_09150 [Nitrososphaeraceae archaeon]|nr:hypothetical protein [Nitrososphaeraceae archaeon]